MRNNAALLSSSTAVSRWLLGHKKLGGLLAALRRTLPSDYPFSLQTNGMLITEEILDLCSEYRTKLRS